LTTDTTFWAFLNFTVEATPSAILLYALAWRLIGRRRGPVEWWWHMVGLSVTAAGTAATRLGTALLFGGSTMETLWTNRGQGLIGPLVLPLLISAACCAFFRSSHRKRSELLNRPWKAEADVAASLTANTDDAALVLRLGLAVTAIRGAHRLTVAVSDSSSPLDNGLRLWSFVLAVAYLHEARVMASPKYPRVRDLAKEGGATDDLAAAVGQIFSGKTRVGQLAERVRNEMVFHFDEGSVRKWIGEQNGPTVFWAEGVGPRVGNTLYRASLDSVAANLLPGVDDKEAMKELLHEVLTATTAVLEFFERAIAGYLHSVGAVIVEE